MSEAQQDLGSIGVKLNNSSWAGKLVKDSYLAIKQGKHTWLLVSFEIVYHITLVTFAFLLLAFFTILIKQGALWSTEEMFYGTSWCIHIAWPPDIFRA